MIFASIFSSIRLLTYASSAIFEIAYHQSPILTLPPTKRSSDSETFCFYFDRKPSSLTLLLMVCPWPRRGLQQFECHMNLRLTFSMVVRPRSRYLMLQQDGRLDHTPILREQHALFPKYLV